MVGHNEDEGEEGRAGRGNGRKVGCEHSSSSRGDPVASRIKTVDLRGESVIHTASGSIYLRRTLAPPKGKEVLLGDSKGREGEEEVHGRKVGYHVAGVYVARAAGTSSNALPLPPLYFLVSANLYFL